MSTEIRIEDEGDFKSAVGDVRDDTSDTNWVLCSHVDNNPNVVCVSARGGGGVEEFVSYLDDTQVQYGYLRFVEQFEMSSTVKFVFVRFMGQEVKPTAKGRYGVVSGSVESHFQKHLTLDVGAKEDISEENIKQLLQEASGTKSKVLETSESRSRPERGFMASSTKGAGAKSSGFTGQSVVKMASGGAAVNFDDNVSEALADVRSDTSDTAWCVAAYTNNDLKQPLTIVDTGVAATDETAPYLDHLKEDIVAYVLYRVIDIVDNIPTVKFAYIHWQGERVKPMTKARSSTHKGAVEEAFGPAHVKIFATTTSEVSLRNVIGQVQAASGSKSRVK